MSTTKYYLVENGKQVGPFSFEELKSKSVVKETLVWFDGLDKWTRAEKIAELSSLLPKNPPPVTEVDDSNIKENVPPIPSIDDKPADKTASNIISWAFIVFIFVIFYLNDFDFSKVMSRLERGAKSIFNSEAANEAPTVDPNLTFEEARKQIVKASEKEQKDKNLEMLVAKVDVDTDITNDFAAALASKFPGEYNILQVCQIYDFIVSEWKYVDDSNKKEIFRSASRSINNGFAGDCDDFAILMAAMIESVGGTARISFAFGNKGGHAFAEVYATNNKEDLQAIVESVILHYETTLGSAEEMLIHYREDAKGGYWINMDWFGEPKQLGSEFFKYKTITTYYPTASTPYYE